MLDAPSPQDGPVLAHAGTPAAPVDAAGVDVPTGPRPLTRGDCGAVPRPCPWTSCRYSLGAHGPESCALDVADRGGHTLEVVAALLERDNGAAPSVTRERIRQIEVKALEALRRGLLRAGVSENDMRGLT